jgi:hypothetical protein
MNRHRTGLITLVTLVTLVITPAAAAKIYKCDGPDGPVYSDRECGPNAANVVIQESSGLSGVTEEDKSALAEKKLAREEEREKERELTRSRRQQTTVINNQYSTYTSGYPGRWLLGPNRPGNGDRPITLPTKPRPIIRPSILR